MSALGRTLAVCLALSACALEPEPPRWDGIEIDALREAFANPTASVAAIEDASADAAKVDQLVGRDRITRLLGAYLGEVFLGRGDARGEQPMEPGAELAWAFADGLEGTHVYALVACPGPGLLRPMPDTPELPFAWGMMRIDAPTLAETLTSTTAIAGQLRLSFSACVLGPFELDGRVDAYRAAAPDEDLALLPQLEIRRVRDARDPDRVLTLDSPVHIVHDPLGVAVHVLLELDQGETLVVTRRVGGEGLELRGRDGTLTCTIVARALSCTRS